MGAHSAVGHLVPGGQLMRSGGHSEGLGSTLSPELREQLFRHQAAIAELLRHFWACFPPQGLPTLTPQVEEKVSDLRTKPLSDELLLVSRVGTAMMHSSPTVSNEPIPRLVWGPVPVLDHSSICILLAVKN